MKSTLLAISFALSTITAGSVHAQGELGYVPPVPPRSKASPQQRADGKTQRRVEGTQAARENNAGELGPVPKAGPKQKFTKNEKSALRSQRKSETARANRAGELPATGEVGPQP